MTKKQKMITGVVGLPLAEDGRILLTKRYAPGKPKWHGKWQLAGGGMEFGETPEQTLARELQEELQVSARIIFPFPMVKTVVWYGDHLDSNADTHITLFCFLVDIGEQKVNISQDEETSDFGWFSPEEALRLPTLPLTDELIQEAVKIIKANNLTRYGA